MSAEQRYIVRFVIEGGIGSPDRGDCVMSGVLPTGSADDEVVAASWVKNARVIAEQLAAKGMPIAGRIVITDVRPI